jgi:hypothetical protein
VKLLVTMLVAGEGLAHVVCVGRRSAVARLLLRGN